MTRSGKSRRKSLGSSLVETMLVVGLVGGIGGTMMSASAGMGKGKALAAVMEVERMVDGIRAAGDGAAFMLAEGAGTVRVDHGGFRDGAAVIALKGTLGPVSFNPIGPDGSRDSAFSMDLHGVPESSCMPLVFKAAERFDDIAVNGRLVGAGMKLDHAAAADACSGTNRISLYVSKRKNVEVAPASASPAIVAKAAAVTVFSPPRTSLDLLAAPFPRVGQDPAPAAATPAPSDPGEAYRRGIAPPAYDAETLAMISADPELLVAAVAAERARLIELHGVRGEVLARSVAAEERRLLEAAYAYSLGTTRIINGLHAAP